MKPTILIWSYANRGSTEQDADVVGFIFREEVYHRDREDLRGLAELIIAKRATVPWAL